jgi:hypothetical protein
MKSRFFHLLVLLIFLTGTLLFVPSIAVHATTLTVINTNDSGPGSLREAIGAAGDGSTIIFSGVSGTITLSSQLNIYNSITITGPGSATLSVSGGDAVRVFYIAGVDVSVSGLTITNGRVTDDYGGGIFKLSGTLMLDQVVISHNQAVKSESVGFGGGIANFSGSLNITNSTLSYNTASNMGGAIYNYFDAGLLMTNVGVDHNQGNSEGGGLAIRGPIEGHTAGTVSLDKVSITNNSAPSDSGGMYSDDSMSITNSLIANNSTSGYAGGLFFYDGGTGTQPITITMTNSTISGNSAVSGAGGVFISLTQALSSVTLNDTTIANNQIIGSSTGGGIFVNGSGINVENTIIAGNTSNGSSIPDDCYGTINSQDYNLIQTTTGCTINGTTTHNIYGVSPQLAALAHNGGPTETMVLSVTSPAIDAGNPGIPGSGLDTCASLDQRGIVRPQGAYCDIGAFEYAVPTFSDVPYNYSVSYGGVTYPLHDHIQALYDAGYTSGCSTEPLSYCPDATLTRVEAAVFMLRGLKGTSYAPPTSGYVFTDDWSSPTVGWGQPWAEGMWDEGLTAGCQTSPRMFCPATTFTRAEASVFGLRIEFGASFTPQAASHMFADDWSDPTISWAEPWAEAAYLYGLLPVCGESGGKPLFCPGDLVTRAWAAYLVVEAKDLMVTP